MSIHRPPSSFVGTLCLTLVFGCAASGCVETQLTLIEAADGSTSAESADTQAKEDAGETWDKSKQCYDECINYGTASNTCKDKCYAEPTVEEFCFAGCKASGFDDAKCKGKCFVDSQKRCYSICVAKKQPILTCKEACYPTKLTPQEACEAGCKKAGGEVTACKEKCAET